jgi:protein-tyrosine-phosphatase
MKTAEREDAIPYDVPGVELGHHGERCSFDAFLEKYELTDPALQKLALIVRGADTNQRQLTPESPGLYALASGFRAMARDDQENMAKQFAAYDALYAYCRTTVKTVVFVCLHGSAKSLIAASHFERAARERGIAIAASFAGVEPDADVPPRVVAGLRADGIDARGRRPHRITAAELRTAWRVVSFGCDLEPIASGIAVERWDEVPAVSEDYARAREAITARVEKLAADLG